jgi:hypothetical protein
MRMVAQKPKLCFASLGPEIRPGASPPRREPFVGGAALIAVIDLHKEKS